jgi:HD superfamily phosphodiesterase
LCRLVSALIRHPTVQELWKHADQGMPVFAHSMDVARLAVDAYPEWRDRYAGFRLDVVLLGGILHDLTKASARRSGSTSHTAIMEREPTVAVEAAATVLQSVAERLGIVLDAEGIDHLWHVIVAHHGPWGMVAPQTPEAALLYSCDNYSATHHRVAPVDANDILPRLSAGDDVAAIAAALGVERTVIKRRLNEAVRAEGALNRNDLLARWSERGAVAIGDVTRSRRIAEAKTVVEFARACPRALVEQVRLAVPTKRSRRSALVEPFAPVP